jgi:cysteine-rich repeat protein
LAPGGICTCESGFELVNKSCADVCGDGISFTNKCDDGNLINGDGCSESCTIEKNYFCVNGSATSSSVCVYHRYDLTLTLFKIDKSSTSNQGIFIFQLTPLLYNLNKLDLAKDTRFECGQSIFVDKISYAKGFLTVYVNFF